MLFTTTPYKGVTCKAVHTYLFVILGFVWLFLVDVVFEVDRKETPSFLSSMPHDYVKGTLAYLFTELLMHLSIRLITDLESVLARPI